MTEFRYSNVEKEMEVYGYDGVVKSHCRMCHGGCGVLVYTKNGKAAKIAGDPDCPINHGTLCAKGLASSQLAYHPDRLTYPVRRVGPKASGKWERISWDQALDTIAERINAYRMSSGPESIVMGYGTGRENEAVIYRFANLLGTPNVLTAGHFCYGPRIATSILTCGTNPIVDYENNPKCIMVWGNNIVISNPDEYKGEPFSVALSKGAKLIAVDPRMTRIAARADVWLQLRPGTDVPALQKKLDELIALKQKEVNRPESFWEEYHLQPLKDIHLTSAFTAEAWAFLSKVLTIRRPPPAITVAGRRDLMVSVIRQVPYQKGDNTEMPAMSGWNSFRCAIKS